MVSPSKSPIHPTPASRVSVCQVPEAKQGLHTSLPRTHHSPASAFWVLGLRDCSTTLRFPSREETEPTLNEGKTLRWHFSCWSLGEIPGIPYALRTAPHKQSLAPCACAEAGAALMQSVLHAVQKETEVKTGMPGCYTSSPSRMT